MFGYTVFLKIGNLAASSLTDMYKDSYQLIGCEFGCNLPSSSQP